MSYNNKVWVENLMAVVVAIVIFLPLVLCVIDAISFLLIGTPVTAIGNVAFDSMPTTVQFWMIADFVLLFIVVCVTLGGY